MKKERLFSLYALMMAAMLVICVTSCSNDDSKVSGLYYYEQWGGYRGVYNFVNGNTVETYGDVSTDRNMYGNRTAAFPLKSGWYYLPDNKHTYGYTIVEDKILIGYDIVLTISGNTLIHDDWGVVLYKWD